MLEKVEEKLNTKIHQIKPFPCPKYVITYRSNLNNLQTKKLQLKK